MKAKLDMKNYVTKKQLDAAVKKIVKRLDKLSPKPKVKKKPGM
jgi:hypothetical protein